MRYSFLLIFLISYDLVASGNRYIASSSRVLDQNDQLTLLWQDDKQVLSTFDIKIENNDFSLLEISELGELELGTYIIGDGIGGSTIVSSDRLDYINKENIHSGQFEHIYRTNHVNTKNLVSAAIYKRDYHYFLKNNKDRFVLQSFFGNNHIGEVALSYLNTRDICSLKMNVINIDKIYGPELVLSYMTKEHRYIVDILNFGDDIDTYDVIPLLNDNVELNDSSCDYVNFIPFRENRAQKGMVIIGSIEEATLIKVINNIDILPDYQVSDEDLNSYIYNSPVPKGIILSLQRSGFYSLANFHQKNFTGDLVDKSQFYLRARNILGLERNENSTRVLEYIYSDYLRWKNSSSP